MPLTEACAQTLPPDPRVLESLSNPLGRPRSDHVALYGVYEISKLLALPEQLEVTLAKVLNVLSNFLDMRHGLIALIGSEGSPEVVVGCGWSETTAKKYFEWLPERAIGQIVVTGMPLVIENVQTDPLFESRDFSTWDGAQGPLSFIGVPIKDRGHVIGTLTIDRPSCGWGTPLDVDVRFLTMIANLVGQTVRLQRLITRDRERLIEEHRRLEKTLDHSQRSTISPQPVGIVGTSPAIRAVLEKIRIVARSNSTVLLRGESGTGKELFARAIHDLSPRGTKPFVSVNCAALPESVLESELFGHEKGAFTGATSQRKGRFELADGGTLLLDEIGEISPAFQAKLLRVLQEGEFERVGGVSTLKVDVRLVAATNRDLEKAVSLGEFRADLYYRISVVPISLPPLRERKSDIGLLAREFLRRFNSEHGTQLILGDEALAVLCACWFPGNVRELENCIRRTATFAHDTCISADDFACRHDQCLSSVLWRNARSGPEHALPTGGSSGNLVKLHSNPHPEAALPEGKEKSPRVDAPKPMSSQEEKNERERLIEAMEAAGWVQAKAARLLGLTPRQVGYALRKLDIPIQKF